MSQELHILKNIKMMTNFIKMDSFFNTENKNWIMDEEKFQDCVSSSSSTSSESSESDLFEEVNSSDQHANGPLQDMSSLLQQLPIKRGLSEHYNGKSQSFTSLSNVRCLEDLAKPENPYNKNKKLKSCKSDGGILEGCYRCRWPSRSKIASRINPKKTSRSGSCGCVRRNSKPPTSQIN
ncbi:Hypothetical predicted protein [Olea europaea subsp. europaea]|uniref:Uncharacterized protein n=1 Tax=Olea europaea subsp. europaea TaxID=158383 RepID=A0A8S0T7E7_OLEEU|nr:Hypothetical predicted protein [Olea europaea subsp. europaea]